jgi:Zn-dependent protease
MGSIIIPLFSILTTGRVLIAWAKPVPIDPRNFRSFKRDDTLVTIAGPLSNLIIAFLCVGGVIGLFYLNRSLHISAPGFGGQFLSYMIKMFYAGIYLNVTLAVFNMIPIPPLDGSHVLANVLPDETAMRFRSIGFSGIFIILLLFNFVPGFSKFFFLVINSIVQPYLNVLDYFIK